MELLTRQLEQCSLSARTEDDLSETERRCVSLLRDLEDEYAARVRGFSGSEYYGHVFKRGRDVTASGYSVYSELHRTLASFVINPTLRERRSPLQIEFHKTLVYALIPKIYGSDWEMNQDAILAKHKISTGSLKRHMLFCCPRRFGKTTAIAMILAALLHCLPSTIRVIVCSQAASTSAIMIRIVMSLLTQIPDADKHVSYKTTNNRPTICYSRAGMRDDPNASTVVAIPSSADFNRGDSADILIFDEMAFMNPYTIAVLAAMLQQTNSIFVALSSPNKDEQSFFNQLLEEKNTDGELLFKVHKTELICHSCRESKQPGSCPHMKDELPGYLTSDASKVIEALMKGCPQMYATEILGISHKYSVEALNLGLLEQMYTKQPLTPYEDAVLVHIFIDPSGGGASKSAIVSFVVYSDFTIGVSTFSLSFDWLEVVQVERPLWPSRGRKFGVPGVG